LTDRLRIAPGDQGEPVRDLQHRLATLGYETAPAEAGCFGESTAAAVRAFQTARGLRVDGICGRQTWSSLVEAGYRLGDRLLYHRTPMLRGDDVLELQQKLNALGFDAGRGDGIFGPHTAEALRDFQRNVAAVPDAICGPESIAALERLSRFAGGSVASVREKEALRDGALRLVIAIDIQTTDLFVEIDELLRCDAARRKRIQAVLQPDIVCDLVRKAVLRPHAEFVDMVILHAATYASRIGDGIVERRGGEQTERIGYDEEARAECRRPVLSGALLFRIQPDDCQAVRKVSPECR